jgi:hypothetical protein
MILTVRARLLVHWSDALAVGVPAGEPDQTPGLGKDRAALWCPGHRYAPAAAEPQQALVAEQVQGAEHGVLAHAEHRGELLRQRKPLPPAGATVTPAGRPLALY